MTFYLKLNPVFIRELRQIVRNRFMIGTIFFYLILLIIACFWKIVSIGDGWTETSGIELWNLVFRVSSLGAAVIVCGYTIVRFAIERYTEDAMFHSGLSPAKILLGKQEIAVLINFLLFCMVLPFLSMVNMLRGTDVFEMIYSYVISFLVIQTYNMILLGLCTSFKKPGHGIGMLLLVSPLLFFTPLHYIYLMLFWSVSDYTVTFLMTVLFIAAGFSFCFGRASLNGIICLWMLGLRCIFGYGISIILSFTLFITLIEPRNALGLFAFVIVCSFIPVLLNSIIGTSEFENWNWRLRKWIPAEESQRSVAYLFFPGAPNAMLWSYILIALGLLSGLTVLIRVLFTNPARYTLGFDAVEYFWYFAVFSSSILIFQSGCMTAILLRKKFLYHWISKDFTWLIAVLIFVPLLIFYNIFAYSSFFSESMNLVPLFIVFAITLFWNAVIVYLSISWFKECYAGFMALSFEEENVPKEPEV